MDNIPATSDNLAGTIVLRDASGKISTNEIESSVVDSGTISADSIDSGTISADSIDSGTISATGIELASGGFITGDFSSPSLPQRTFFRSKDTVLGFTSVGAVPSDDNNTTSGSSFDIYGSTDVNNSPVGTFQTDGSFVAINVTATGSASFVPFIIGTSNQARVTVSPEGSIGVGISPTKKIDIYSAGTATTDCVIRNDTVSLLSLVNATAASFGTSTNHPLLFNTNNSEKIRIDTSGNVGIGTSSPSQKLDVNGNTTISGNVGIGTSSPSQKLDVNGNVAITGSLTSTDGTSTLSLFNSAGVGTLGTTTNHPFSLQTNSVNRVRVATDGNVGIGTDTPAEKLVLSTASGKVYGLCTNGTASNVFGVTSTDAGIFGTTTAHHVEIHANNAERIRIDTNGNVGIGTTPSTKLHVSGDVRIDGDLIAGNSGTSSRSLTLGDGRTGNGNAFIDLVGDTTYTDYGLRLIRNNTGANANSELIHRGTGSLQIKASDAGTVSLFASNTERFRLSSGGNILLFHTNAALPGFNNTNTGITFETPNTVFLSRSDNVVMFTNRNSDGALVSFRRSGTEEGNIFVTTTSTSYNSTSDYRLKENPTPLSDGLSVIDAVKPVRFIWKSEGSVGKGFIAHELQAVIPEAVTGEKDAVDGDGNPAYQGVDASKIVPYLVSAVKELKLRLEALEL